MGDAALTLLVMKTHRVEELRGFYAALGVEFVEERHGVGPVHYAGRAGAVVLEIYPLREGTPAEAATRLGFTVPDVAAVVAALQARGTLVVRGPLATEGERAVVRDPDGRAVELYQR